MIRIADQLLNPRLIIFDKDGTLISFHAMWHGWFAHMLLKLSELIPLDDCLQQAMADTLGYDRFTDVWDPLGALTIAATSEVLLLMSGVIYRHGNKTWLEAVDLVRQAERLNKETLNIDDLVEPVGDVRTLMAKLRALGIKLAVATTDDRARTLRNISQLQIGDLVDTLVCGDDGILLKPEPDMALEVCRRLGIEPRDAIMIGDTVADLEMAHRAGLACAIGVTSGALPKELLAPCADIVIPDIQAIQPLAE